MRAILIDPMNRKIDRVLDEFNDVRTLHFHVQSSVITSATLGPTHCILIDELGPHRKGQYWFGIVGMPVALAGRGLILQKPKSEDGGFGPCQMDLERIRETIRWFDDPAEAEALVPPTQIRTGPTGKVVQEIPTTGIFRTLDKELIDRSGKVIPYDPTRFSPAI